MVNIVSSLVESWNETATVSGRPYPFHPDGRPSLLVPSQAAIRDEEAGLACPCRHLDQDLLLLVLLSLGDQLLVLNHLANARHLVQLQQIQERENHPNLHPLYHPPLPHLSIRSTWVHQKHPLSL
jgi:hypothetical protein